jgi:hypothetical protein
MKPKDFHNDLSKISEAELLALAMKQINGRDLLPHRTAQVREMLKNAKFVHSKKKDQNCANDNTFPPGSLNHATNVPSGDAIASCANPIPTASPGYS